jgi:hypothetical protein
MRMSAFITLVGFLCISAFAHAGHPAAPLVNIVESERGFAASAALGAVHNASNQREEVACSVRSYFGAMEVRCAFTNAEGRRASCRAGADVASGADAIERMVKVANTISGSSFVEVTALGQRCTSLKVTNSSRYVAKNSSLKTVVDSAFVAKSAVAAWHDEANAQYEITGTLSAARRAGDHSQFIGCELRVDEGRNQTAQCVAFDHDGAGLVWCDTDIRNQILALSGLKSDSNLWFYFSFDGTIDCNARVEVTHSSSFDASH